MKPKMPYTYSQLAYPNCYYYYRRWNRLEYARHREMQSRKRYQLIAAKEWEGLALDLEAAYPERFHFHHTK